MKVVHSTLSEDLLRALGCSAIGIAAPAFIMSIPTALLLFPIFAFYGAILGLPALVVILPLVVSFRSSIHRNLGGWCFAAPFLTVIVTAIFAQAVIVGGSWLNESGYGVFRHLEMPLLLVPMFLGSMLSAGLFYHWTRRRERRAVASSSDFGVPERKALP